MSYNGPMKPQKQQKKLYKEVLFLDVGAVILLVGLLAYSKSAEMKSALPTYFLLFKDLQYVQSFFISTIGKNKKNANFLIPKNLTFQYKKLPYYPSKYFLNHFGAPDSVSKCQRISSYSALELNFPSRQCSRGEINANDYRKV